MDLIDLMSDDTHLDRLTLTYLKRAEELISEIKNCSDSKKSGVSEDLYHIGLEFDAGGSICQSDEVAFICFLTAAEAGHVEAQYRVGLAYDTGYGVDENLSESRRWYGLAAEQDHPKALCGLGYSYFRDESDPNNANMAANCFLRSEQLFDPEGTYYLGLCYLEGYGVRKSVERAECYIRKASELGSSDAKQYLSFTN